MAPALLAGSVSRRLPIGAISTSCFFDPICCVCRLSHFRLHFRQSFSRSPRARGGRSLFSRNARHSLRSTISLRQRNNFLFGPDFTHRQRDSFDPRDRRGNGHRWSKNGRLRFGRNRFLPIFRRKSGWLLPRSASRPKLGKLFLFHGAVWNNWSLDDVDLGPRYAREIPEVGTPRCGVRGQRSALSLPQR